MPRIVRSALALLVGLALPIGSPARAEEKIVYKPVAAKVGKPLTAPPALLAMTETLRAAALAGDRDAVFLHIADDVTFVDSGITPTVGRTAEKRAFGPDRAEAALEAIGLAFTEGEPVAPAGKTFDMKSSRIATALTRIAAELEAPDWGSDPLVPGGWCTQPGASWDPKAAEKAGLSHRAVFLLAPAEALAKPETGAKMVARLDSGRLWALAGSDTTEGWTHVALPDGRTAWLPAKTAKDAQPWGFCFLPDGEGGWLLSAVVSALN